MCWPVRFLRFPVSHYGNDGQTGRADCICNGHDNGFKRRRDHGSRAHAANLDTKVPGPHLQTGRSVPVAWVASGTLSIRSLALAVHDRPPDFVRLHVGDEIRIDLTLAPGENHETVVIRESAPLVETGTSRAATIVDQHAIQDLPSDGRQLQNLALIAPGIDAGWNVSTAANRYGKARENTEGAFSVNGARSRSNDFLVDGMPMNVRQYNVMNFQPSNEAVQEFSVIASIPERRVRPDHGRQGKHRYSRRFQQLSRRSV